MLLVIELRCVMEAGAVADANCRVSGIMVRNVLEFSALGSVLRTGSGLGSFTSGVTSGAGRRGGTRRTLSATVTGGSGRRSILARTSEDESVPDDDVFFAVSEPVTFGLS